MAFIKHYCYMRLAWAINIYRSNM